MSNRNYFRGHLVPGPRRVHIAGSFACPASSAGVTPSTVKGLHFGYAPLGPSFVMALRAQPGNNPTPLSTPGIVYNSAGNYTLTLEDTFIDYDGYDAELSVPSGGPYTNIVNILNPPANFATLNTAPSFTFVTTNSGGTPTDLGATFRINFNLWLRDSTVEYGKP
jgi:hypothetical protein